MNLFFYPELSGQAHSDEEDFQVEDEDDWMGNTLGNTLGDGDMPTITCACCTGNGSTLGPLGKRRRVGADPTPGWDNTDLPDLPKSETLAVSEYASPLWPGSARNKKTSES